MKNVLAIGKAPTAVHEKWMMEFSSNMIEALKEGTPPVRLSAREWTDGRVLIYLEYVDHDEKRLRGALEEIAEDLGHPGSDAWRCAMEALGRDWDAAEKAWHD